MLAAINWATSLPSTVGQSINYDSEVRSLFKRKVNYKLFALQVS